MNCFYWIVSAENQKSVACGSGGVIERLFTVLIYSLLLKSYITSNYILQLSGNQVDAKRTIFHARTWKGTQRHLRITVTVATSHTCNGWTVSQKPSNVQARKHACL
jgi:hypothetical protein